MLVDLVRRGKRIGTAARSKALVMLRRSYRAGLQLEVAKRIGAAARIVHSCATRNCSWTLQNALCGLREEKSWVAQKLQKS